MTDTKATFMAAGLHLWDFSWFPICRQKRDHSASEDNKPLLP